MEAAPDRARWLSGVGVDPVTDDGHLPLRRLAAYSGLSVRRLRDYLRDPVTPIPHDRIGGKIVVRRSEFDVWVSLFRADVRNTVDRVVDDLVQGLR